MISPRQQILQYIQQDRLPHGLLLCDDNKDNALALVQEISQWLLCPHRQDDLKACGLCQACQWFQQATHPDYKILVPDDKTQMIKVDEIRQLLSKAYQQSAYNQYQVIVIHQADLLNVQASNALLKFLEEPRDNTYILLTAAQPSSLLPTIISRCQVLQASNDTQNSVDDDLYHELAADLEAVVTQQANPLNIAERWQSLNVDRVLYSLLVLVSDVIKYQMVSPSNVTVKPAITALAKHIGLKKLHKMSDELIQIRKELSEVNVNTEIAFDVLLLNATVAEGYIHVRRRKC